jgi:hypothetical protein
MIVAFLLVGAVLGGAATICHLAESHARVARLAAVLAAFVVGAGTTAARAVLVPALLAGAILGSLSTLVALGADHES